MGSILGPVKSDPVSPRLGTVVTIFRSLVDQALTCGDCYSLRRNCASVMKI